MTAAFSRCPEPYEVMQRLEDPAALTLKHGDEAKLMRIVGVAHAATLEAIELWGDVPPTRRERRLIEKAIRSRVLDSVRSEQSTGVIAELILSAIVAEVVKMLIKWWLEG